MDTALVDLTLFLRQAQTVSDDRDDVRWPFIYQKLRSIAARLMRTERQDHTLSINGLVHETYLRLFSGSVNVQNREHFFRLFTRAMKRTLIDYARNRNAQKRQGYRFHRSIDDIRHLPDPTGPVPYSDLEEALEQITRIDPRLGRVVQMKFFEQMTIEEMAERLDVSTRTVDRNLKRARLLLYHLLKTELSPVPAA